MSVPEIPICVVKLDPKRGGGEFLSSNRKNAQVKEVAAKLTSLGRQRTADEKFSRERKISKISIQNKTGGLRGGGVFLTKDIHTGQPDSALPPETKLSGNNMKYSEMSEELKTDCQSVNSKVSQHL